MISKYIEIIRWVNPLGQARSDTSIVLTVRLRSPRSPSLYPYPSTQFRDNICEKCGLLIFYRQSSAVFMGKFYLKNVNNPVESSGI